MSLFHTPTCFEHMCSSSEVKTVLYSLWYHHTYRWPSGAQIERGPDRQENIKTFKYLHYYKSLPFKTLNIQLTTLILVINQLNAQTLFL